MRLRTLELLAFGHFSGEVLAFAEDPGTIDFVYGDNEAGKSTTLRAVTGLLYGIPARTTDNFRHEMPTMRIGAEVVSAEGVVVPLVRRKGTKDTLRDQSGNPLSDDLLSASLGGLDLPLYERMFVLTRESLAAGAQDLLQGKGAAAAALFGASLGLAGVNAVLEELETEAAGIFRPNAQNPHLNALLRRLEEQRRNVKQRELRRADFEEQARALDTAQRARSDVDARLAGLNSELRQLERNRQLLPLLALRQRLLENLEDLGEVVKVSDSARRDREDAQRRRAEATTEIDNTNSAIAALEEKIGSLAPSSGLLAEAAVIRDLHKQIGGRAKATADLPKLQAELRGRQDDVTRLLAQTGLDPEAACVRARPPLTAVTAITDLAREFERLTQAESSAENDLEAALREVDASVTDSASLVPLADISGLRAALATTQRLGDIEARIADEEAHLSAEGQDLNNRASALPLCDGAVSSIVALEVPTEATIDRFEQIFFALEEKRRTLEAERARLRDEEDVLTERLGALESGGDVPSEAELRIARRARDDQWRQVRALLDEPAGQATAVSVADSFELKARTADDVADRLRRDADRVAQHAELLATRLTTEAAATEVERQAAELAYDAAAANAEWTAAWAPGEIKPLTPREMRGWLLTHAQLRQDALIHTQAASALIACKTVRDTVRSALAKELIALGTAVDLTHPLAFVLELAEQSVEEHSRAVAEEAQRQERLAVTARAHRKALTAAGRARSAMADWESRWQGALNVISLPSRLGTTQVDALLKTLESFHVAREAAGQLERRIDGIARDAAAFEDAAFELAARASGDLAGMEGERLVALLYDRLTEAQDARSTRAQLMERLEEKRESLQQAVSTRDLAAAEIQRLLDQAGCKTEDELSDVETRSERDADLRRQLAEIDVQVTVLGADSPEAAQLSVEGKDIDSVDASIDLVTRALEELGEQRRTLDHMIGGLETRLGQTGGGDEAAAAADEAEAIKAEAGEHIERYVRLRLASAVLRAEIERFRADAHGPLLRRAGEFFSVLTCGDHSGLTVGLDEKNEVILLAQRATGAEITVDKMSEGTRDQLYLALRLASLEQHLLHTEPLPLLVDDLFITFDDDRAAAGIRVLSKIAKRTQVVFFTHHHHLLDIANDILAPEKWRAQRLQPGSAPTTIATIQAAGT